MAKKVNAAKKAPKAKEKKAAAPKARQARLPQMDDAKIEELHGLSEVYVEARDARIKLTTQEVAAKDDLISAMHRHDKKGYRFQGLVIELKPEGEKLRVRVEEE